MIARWTSEERVDDRFAMLSYLGNDRFDPHLARFARFSVGAEVARMAHGDYGIWKEDLLYDC